MGVEFDVGIDARNLRGPTIASSIIGEAATTRAEMYDNSVNRSAHPFEVASQELGDAEKQQESAKATGVTDLGKLKILRDAATKAQAKAEAARRELESALSSCIAVQ
jgi:hypothetical protein